MKKIILILALLPLVAVVIAFNPNALRVQFAQTDWDAAKRRAISEQKLFFVDFDASYCATCRTMDESTYMDMNLSEYINQNVIAHRVNVQDFDGVMWSQNYEVEALPTMLVFDAKGRLVERLVGYKSASDLMRVFKEVRAKEVATTTTTTNTTPMQSETQMDNSKVVVPPTPALVNTTPANTAATPAGLFEITARRQESRGYGIQVGVFSSYENLLDKAAEMRERFPQQRTILHVEPLNGQTSYKLLLGVFASRRDAISFSYVLKQRSIEGIVKDLSLLR